MKATGLILGVKYDLIVGLEIENKDKRGVFLPYKFLSNHLLGMKELDFPFRYNQVLL